MAIFQSIADRFAALCSFPGGRDEKVMTQKHLDWEPTATTTRSPGCTRKDPVQGRLHDALEKTSEVSPTTFAA